uniref:Gag-pol polyprotein n=1 Tax=Solanum tuberosum TaxID=4113 RepID=M1DTH1_SOLTU
MVKRGKWASPRTQNGPWTLHGTLDSPFRGPRSVLGIMNNHPRLPRKGSPRRDPRRPVDMGPRRAYVRRNVNENVEREVPQAPPQAPQVPIDPLAEQVTNDEFLSAFHTLAQAMTA